MAEMTTESVKVLPLITKSPAPPLSGMVNGNPLSFPLSPE